MTQEAYIDDLLEECGVDGVSKTPASEDLFDVRDDAVLATTEQQVWFHRQVARVLYLAKRTKPETLVATAFLATRVTKCDEDDIKKLQRLLKYIRSVRERGIVLKPGCGDVTVTQYIDAAYGVHADGKGHTGSVTIIGDAAVVDAASKKQTIVAKSSTEAELIGVSDSLGKGFHMRRFIIAQGHTVDNVVLYQDNLSTMALLNKGRASLD